VNQFVTGNVINCLYRETGTNIFLAQTNPTAIQIPAFTIIIFPPVISQVTPVTTPSTDTTPSYTFTTNKIGTITYGGSCSSATTNATVGNNTITFNG
jgi:hypothetical protein